MTNSTLNTPNPAMAPTADDYADLPQQMRDAKRWLLWRSEPGDKKPRKVPYYASGKHRHGSLDSPEDVSQFVILDDAIKALQTGRYTGLGFALGPDGTGNNWQGIDLDHLPEHPELQHVADTLPGYTERSPSKTGMHAIGYGRTFDGLGSNTTGIEAYSKGRYFTVTADGAGLHDPCDLAEFVDGVLRPLHSPQKTQQGTKQATGSTEYATEYADPQTVQDLRSALGFLKPDSDNRKTWIDVAHYLRKLGTTGFELWDTWSQASEKYDPLEQTHRWHTIYPDRVSVGYKAVFERAQAAGWVNTRAKVNPSTGEINQHIGGFGYTQAQVDAIKAADPSREFTYDTDTGSWHEVRKLEPTFTRVSLADVFTNPPPDQEYVLDGLIPRGVLTLLSANGGTGKSLMTLQLAAHRALEKPFLGLQTKRTGKTLYFSAEDGTDIVRRRFASVCKADSLNPAEVSENLIVLDATDNPALYVEKMAAGVRGGEKTHAYNKLASMIKDEGVDFLIVDNASDSYDADPIDRQRVGEFVRLLVKLVKAQQGTVLLLAHVNRNTARGHGSNSQDFADSAAWHNKARSRLFLKAEKENSPDLILEHQKANLGRKREPLLLTMREYGGVGLRGAGVDFSGLMARQEGREDDMAAAALLKILAEYESREQYASPSPTARNNVFSLLRAEPSFKKLNLSAEDVKRLVQQSSRAAWIEPLEYKSAHTRKYCQRWTVTAKGKAHIEVCAPTSPTAPT